MRSPVVTTELVLYREVKYTVSYVVILGVYLREVQLLKFFNGYVQGHARIGSKLKVVKTIQL